MEINKKKTSIENKEEIRKNINAKRIMLEHNKMFFKSTRIILLKEHKKT